MAMLIDPGTLVVSHLIAHRVPRLKGADDKRQPRLSTSVPSHPPATLDFFTSRLKRNLTENGQEVEVDPELEQPRLPALVRDHLHASTPDLVATSQAAARLLFEAQGGSKWEEESLFIALQGTVDGQAAIALLKLEKESGVEFDEADTDDGGTTLVVSVNDHLLLTDNTRMFKAALLVVRDGDVFGLVSDDQQGAPTEVARYFLNKFLGCEHRRSAAVVTGAFYRTVERFISAEVASSEDKLNYQAALHTELTSQRKRIAPQVFISDNFKPEHRAPLEARLVEAGVPVTRFDKDTTRIGRKTHTSRLKTAGGITISGEAETMAERLRADHDPDGTPIIIIRDTLKSV